MKKKIIALVLSVLMLLSVAPIAMAGTLGDIDSNGKIDATDARTALRAAVGLDKLTADQAKLADVDFDGDVDATDARLILRAAVGLEDLHVHSFTSAVTTAATCEGKGVKTFTCSCGDSYTEEIPALGHKSVTDKATAPTCTADGKTQGAHCSVCNKVLKAQEKVNALGHKSVTDKAVAPTCTESGLTEGAHCSVCNEVIKKQEKVPATGHTTVTDKAVAATCTESGLTEGAHCSVCNAVIKKQETVPAKGHTSVTDKAADPTCTASGLTEGAHCSACNTVLKAQETVSALGHKSVTDKAVAPTCTEKGKTEGAHCSVCNTVLKPQALVNALGHTSVTDKAVSPTCTASGLTEGSHCSVCNTVLTAQQTIPATGHTTVTDKAVAPTCTSTGKTEGAHCSVCNTVLKPQALVNALGHQSTLDNSTVVAPTCDADGYSGDYKCSVCGVITETGMPEPALGHQSTLDNSTVVAPTCTTEGYSGDRKCGICGAVTETGSAVPSTGHQNSSLDENTVVEATCGKDGYTGDCKCDVCGEVTATGEIIPADESRHVYEETFFEASCTADEYTAWQCIYCEHIDATRIEESGLYPNGLGHTFGDVTTVAPNCEEDGYDTKTCSVCTYEERSNFVPSTGHRYGMAPDRDGKLAPTCQSTGYRKYTCRNANCGYVKTEIDDAVACDPSVAVIKHGTKTEDGAPTDYCYTEYSCKFCQKLVSTAENYGAHVMYETGTTTKTCTTPTAKYMACEYCSYENIVYTEEAPGHTCSTIQQPTCTADGFITTSGTCTACGETVSGETIVLPATGHKLTGVQTCTTSVSCEICKEVTAPAFGHSFTKISPAVANSTDKNVPTFFCTRCGAGCEDKVATFNALTDRIKIDFYGKYDYTNGYPKLHRFIKTSAENTPSNINFGIYTSIVRDMFEEEMGVTPVTYDRITKMSVIGALPIYTEDYVSLLGQQDVDSITVERVSGLDFSQVLSGFDDKFTSGKTEYDLTPYKATKVQGNVIKVTIDVKNEKFYGGIDKLPAAEQTSLQKIFGVDVREQLFSKSGCTKDCPENCAEHHYVKGGDGKLYMETNQDGMGMKMTLNDMSTDGKVTYYFLEETYEPIIAVYEEAESMNQHMEMEINVGLTIKGKMDTLSKTNSVTVYVFPGYLPKV